MFQFDPKEGFPLREERILRLWKQGRFFERSLEQRAGCPLFSFYDGPPFATGLPHYGHLLAGTIKDVIPRYKAMKGFYVPRRFGWDCHGLPVENEIEKAQELSGANAIEAFGVGRFNEECRKIVLRYTAEWEQSVDRMGRWVNFSNAYRTMDRPFMESVWGVFKKLYDQGLVYQGMKVMPFSTKLGTPLSNFEANLNYKEVDDPSVIVAFAELAEEGVFFLAWTTTPWTLPSNLALVAKRDLTYVKVAHHGKHYILAEARLEACFKQKGEYEILDRFSGSALEGRRYRPLFPFFAGQPGAFRIVLDDFVTTEDGTGIVHAAPAFGEEDFFVCKREGIEPVCPVDHNGRFTKEVPPYEGTLVKDADPEIIRALKHGGHLFWQGTVHHRYPFCWRSDTPLIYKAVQTWFVAVEKVKDKLVAANEQIHWVPDHIKHGRFGKWLENARDWAISRNRYWGTPIPLWRSDSGKIYVVGSGKELEELMGAQIDDLHRHYIDEMTFVKDGETYRRIPEVFDCWFESGSMPYAQTDVAFPADFIAEGLDQTRGWFYTLTVLAAALFDKPAFKNVIVNGIVLAEDGNKMSKRLKNYPDPDIVLNKHGADALRLYLMSSPAVKAEDLRFSEKGVELVLRQVLIPLWNSFVFLSTYARIYNWTPNEERSLELIDRWIVSLAQKLAEDVGRELDNYELNAAVPPLVDFVDQLTNWYIRRSRSRFWNNDPQAMSTLYVVLLQLVKIAAPFAPFICEAIYQELKRDGMEDSVHLCDFPVADGALRDRALEEEMAAAQRAVSLGHSVRKQYQVKVRQPLAQAYLISSNEELMNALERQQQLIADELNVKEVTLHREEEQFVKWSVKPNFPLLGKKAGARMPELKRAIEGLSGAQVRTLVAGKSLQMGDWLLEPGDVFLERNVKAGLAASNEGELTLALDLTLNEALIQEGFARELVNKINTMRREQGFEVTDRIAIAMQTTPRVKEAFERHRDYVMGEVLAKEIEFGPCEGAAVDLNGESATLHVKRLYI